MSFPGGTANGATVKGGGLEIVSDGGFEHGATVSSGGTFAAIGSAQVGGDTFLGGAVVEFGSGFAHPISGAPLSGVAVQFLILSGGTLGGGEAQRANVVTVRSGGLASGFAVDSGAKLFLLSGGTGTDLTVSAGGSAVASSGAVVELLSGDIDLAASRSCPCATPGGRVGRHAGPARPSAGASRHHPSGGTASGGTISAGRSGILESGGQITSDRRRRQKPQY